MPPLTFEQYVMAIPLRVPSKRARADYSQGSWIGYFVRAVLRYDCTADEARRITICALGPGHDYEPLGPGDCDGSKGGRSTGVGYAFDGNTRGSRRGGAD